MRKVGITACMLLIVIGLTVAAEAATVICNGQESGGSGPRLYIYEVTLGPGESMTAFDVGTCDLSLMNYWNWLQPAGWAPVPFSGSEPHIGLKTPHGMISPGPAGNCAGAVMWTGPALGPGTWLFGYDNENRSHDVGWTVSPLANPSNENWSAPVGMGFGPVHGPLPEPAMLSLLVLGGPALMRRRR